MDDTSFLQNNSETGSYLALIDSALRDTTTWPTAAQFEVVFDTPFNMVYGIDLLGVSVPRTEYSVSTARNVVVFSYGLPGQHQKHTVLIPEGNYDTLGFIQALNLALKSFASANGNTLAVSSLSAVATVSNRVQFTCTESFSMYLSESSLRLVVGFADPVNKFSTAYSALQWYPGGPDTVTSVLSPGLGAILLAYSNTTTGGQSTAVTAPAPVRTAFTAANSGVVTSVAVGVASSGTPTTIWLQWRVLTTDLQTALGSGQIEVDLDNATSMGAYTALRGPLLAGQQYILEIADPLNGDSQNCYTVGAAASVSVQGAFNTVTPPGLLDLSGERYLTLRCLEIESPINGSRAFEKWTAGVGMIQLGAFGYNSQAYDYTAYPPRTFQPIGNLSKLTLSFRKTDNSLYDFKGLNLQLLLLIKFLLPRTPRPNDALAPQYQPYLPRVVSEKLRDEIRHNPQYAWMPR